MTNEKSQIAASIPIPMTFQQNRDYLQIRDDPIDQWKNQSQITPGSRHNMNINALRRRNEALFPSTIRIFSVEKAEIDDRRD